MIETLNPYFTMLPFGAALTIGTLGVIPSIVILARASRKKPSGAQTAFACAAALVGAWGTINAMSTMLLPL